MTKLICIFTLLGLDLESCVGNNKFMIMSCSKIEGIGKNLLTHFLLENMDKYC